MYKTTSNLQPVSVSTLSINQKFTISRNGAPSFNVHTFKGGFFDKCYAITSKGNLRMFNPEQLVFKF